MLSVLLNFAFLNTYNQNVRSTKIDQFFETLPDHLKDVQPYKSLVLHWERMEISVHRRVKFELNNKDPGIGCNTTPKQLLGIHTRDLFVGLREMIEHRDIVTLMTKNFYQSQLLNTFKYFIDCIADKYCFGKKMTDEQGLIKV